ncbi:arginase family protein [Aestuariivirga sp.]|uniref:arginase family protein n=1 Tax=Aestuariivirga sp. TaxID=2650926 RepID=UPI0025B82BE5|nr:arginase family protein [Aestuariivirga sp.]MCA3556595.1 arginase family protein [Aestuariivirga sp.]
MPALTAVPPFLGAIRAATPEGFDAAIFGAPHGTPYPEIDNSPHAGAPDAFRSALAADAEWLDHWDFDLGGPRLRHGQKICDLGNLKTRPRDGAHNRALIGETTRRILEAGAVPIMFGGDDSAPIPFIAAYSEQPAIVILQIDAHIDWRQERRGEAMGFSSTMRRAAEHDHVWRIVQAGARGVGSAREQEVREALAWGAHIVTAREVHHKGVAEVLRHIPEECNCVISFDCDALDAAEMPAVAYPTPGGLSYTQVTDLIAGVAAKARIAGFCMVEFVPLRDRSKTAAFTAARIAANVVGRIGARGA